MCKGIKILADDNGRPMLTEKGSIANPFSVIHESYFELIRLYFTCRDFRCLPFAGGLLDQPTNLYESFTIISTELNQKDK